MKTCKKGLHQYPEEHKSCKECKKIASKKWDDLNRDRRVKNYKKYYSKNKKEINQRSRDYYYENKESVSVQRKQYAKINKSQKYLKSREWFLKKRYNLTIKELDELYQKQNYCCAICKQFENKTRFKLHIDHNHKTGEVRGLLCGNCNRAIGLFKDDVNICLNAFNYLLKPIRGKNGN